MTTLNQTLDARDDLWIAIQNQFAANLELNPLFLLPLKRKFHKIFDDYNPETNTNDLINEDMTQTDYRHHIHNILYESLTSNERNDYHDILNAMFTNDDESDDEDEDNNSSNTIYTLLGVYFEKWITYAITYLLPNVSSDDSDSDSDYSQENPNHSSPISNPNQ